MPFERIRELRAYFAPFLAASDSRKNGIAAGY